MYHPLLYLTDNFPILQIDLVNLGVRTFFASFPNKTHVSRRRLRRRWNKIRNSHFSLRNYLTLPHPICQPKTTPSSTIRPAPYLAPAAGRGQYTSRQTAPPQETTAQIPPALPAPLSRGACLYRACLPRACRGCRGCRECRECRRAPFSTSPLLHFSTPPLLLPPISPRTEVRRVPTL